MSSGTWCLVRDLGLVKGGKGMRHFETIVAFSFKGVRKGVREWLRKRQLAASVHEAPANGAMRDQDFTGGPAEATQGDRALRISA